MLVASLLVTTFSAPVVVRIPAGLDAPAIEAKIAATKRRPDQPLELQFAPGDYRFSRSLAISGNKISLVGKNSRLLGGTVVRGWHPVQDSALLGRVPEAARSKVLTFDTSGLKLGDFTPRGFASGTTSSHSELFANGQPLRPARYPNLDAPEGGWLKTGDVTGRTFKATDPRPGSWKSLENVWLYGYWMYDWADSYEPLAGFEEGSVKIGEGTGVIKAFGLGKGRRFFYSNVLEELDQPGEYWLDARHNTIVAWLPQGTNEVVVSDITMPILAIRQAEDVTVRGFTIEGSRADGVEIRDSKSVVLTDCVIRNVGRNGVVIEGGSGCGVLRSEVTGVGESGVTLNGGDRRTLTASGHFVQDSNIHHVSRWCRTYRPAVNMNGVGQRIIGNRLTDLPHNAILFGGNDHLIERNDVQRACQETGDAGAFYVGRDVTTRGTVIRWNRFRGVDPRVSTEGNFTEVMSVYLDDCQAGISIIGNIFESSGTAIMLGGGRDNIVEGNVFLGCKPAVHFDARARGWAKDYFASGWGIQDRIKAVPVLESPWRERYPRLYADIQSGADLTFPTGCRAVGNVALGGEFIRYLDGLTEKDWDFRENVFEKGSGTLKQAMALLPKRFQNIPVEEIGVNWPSTGSPKPVR